MVEGTRLECADPDSIIEQMMREHADYVLRLCLLYLNDYHLAEDAMQETFIKAHRGLSRFGATAAPTPGSPALPSTPARTSAAPPGCAMSTAACA